MQGVGCADALMYFKCPTTKQMLCRAVNAFGFFILGQQPQPGLTSAISEHNLNL
jgi:hypothetical protein